MTKQEVLDDIKALYKELYDKLKQGKISKAEYTSLYDQLNEAMYQLNMGKISAAVASFSLNPVMMALQKADSAAPASGNPTAGMTQDEYDKQKKAMYQKYKAGEITNYAYIQWKKQNNPAGKAPGGAVSAPVAKKAQTAAQQPQAAKTAAVGTKNAAKTAEEILGLTIADVIPDVGVYTEPLIAALNNGTITQEQYTKAMKKVVAGSNKWQKQQKAAQTAAQSAGQTASGMTQAEFDAKKKEMYQKYKNGEITNYAYIQWKKQNDPSKQGAAAAQTGSKAAAAASTSKAKQPMTEAEYKALYDQMMNKAKAAGMDVMAQLDLSKQMMDLKKAGGTVAEAEKLINGIKAAPKTGWTVKEHNEIYDKLYTKKENGTITDGELTKLVEQMDALESKGVKPEEAKKIMMDAVQFVSVNSMTPEEAVNAAENPPKVPEPKGSAKTPMTNEEYDALMEQITESGNKALTGEDIKKIEKLAEIMSEGKLSAKEAAAAIGMSGTPIQASAYTASNAEPPITEEQLKELKKQLKQKYIDGEINQDLFDDIGWELDSEAKSGKSLKEVEEIMHASVLNNYINGIAVEGTIEYEETDTLNDLVEKMLAAGYDEDDIKGKIDQIVEQSYDNGQPVEDAMADMGINPDNIPPKGKGGGMTDEQLKQIKTELAQKYAAGDITWDELNDIGAELNKLKAAGIGYNEAAIIAGAMADGDDLEKAALIAGVDLPESMKQAVYAVSDTEVHDLLDDLYKKVQKGTIKQEEYEALANQAMQLQTENKSVDEIKAAIGLDPGTLAAEKAADDLTDELKDVYGQAAKELQVQFDEFSKKMNAQLTEMSAKLNAGEITQAEYNAWFQAKVKESEYMHAKIEQMSDTMLHANQKAVAMINGETLGVFAENANFQAYQITQDAKINLSFAVYDESTVKKLIQDKPELLPRKVVNGQKDKAWNQKQIAGAVTQAVLQGESIPKLAKRIARETASTNMKAMVRYARTAMTGAQNAGRMEMLHQAKGMGIGVKKRWLATLDSRTRHNHRKLDGQIKDVDEPFEGEFGKIMFPGDPEGHPGDVYNCRCTLVYEYEGFPEDPADDQRLYYDEYTTIETDAKGNQKEVKHREAHLITDMNYDEWKAAKEGSKLNELNIAKVTLAEAQKAVLKAKISETKQYKDIWKDPVTLADYEAKKDAIQGKRDYYETEIQKYKDAIAKGSSWATEDKLKELEKKLKALNEFEKNGKLLADRNKALKDVQDLYDAVGFQKTAGIPNLVTAQKKPKKAAAKTGGTSAGAAGQTAAGLSLGAAGEKKTQFAPDAWDAKTKKAARNFNSKGNADKVLRPELDAIWDNLTDEEKYGVWLYTWNSNPMNKPLSGHHDSWDRSKFLGYDKTEWGHEDNYSNRDISQCGEMGRFARRDGHAEYKKGIMYATNAIEKSTLQEGQWLVRGSDENGLAGWFAGAGMDFASVTDLFNGKYTEKDMQRALVGKRAINHAFTSTGIATGTGFGGNVKYKIYAPKGTKGIYAEPQSHYGDTTGDYYGSPAPKNRRDKIYKKGEKYKSVGDEAEIIIQRGTTYRCTGLKVTGTDWQGKPKIEIELEIVEQPDYFQYGDEDTYNNGKTRHKR